MISLLVCLHTRDLVLDSLSVSPTLLHVGFYLYLYIKWKYCWKYCSARLLVFRRVSCTVCSSSLGMSMGRYEFSIFLLCHLTLSPQCCYFHWGNMTLGLPSEHRLPFPSPFLTYCILFIVFVCCPWRHLFFSCKPSNASESMICHGSSCSVIRRPLRLFCLCISRRGRPKKGVFKIDISGI